MVQLVAPAQHFVPGVLHAGRQWKEVKRVGWVRWGHEIHYNDSRRSVPLVVLGVGARRCAVHVCVGE